MANLAPSHHPYAHLDHSYQYPLNQHHPAPHTPQPQPQPHPSETPASSFPSTASCTSASFPSQMPPQGTAENPLIPKRRRRTTPAELAILDSEYRQNPRPDPLERARIAERLGMTARAVQVWYQNRRQKEKKESSAFGASSSTASSVASSGSDPRDLDGVVLSFSSSPLPSPSLPLYPTVGSAAVDPFKALAAPSSELYSSRSAAVAAAAANKENSLPSSAPSASRPAPTPLQTASAPASTTALNYQYHYSYPSSASLHPSAPHSSALSHAYTSPSVPSVYLHRPHNASIIAAKKHVRKRPLGSHAPLARTPSLPHAFDFPPSPEKKAAAPAAQVLGSRKASLNDVVTRRQTATSAGLELRRSVSASAAAGLGLFSGAAGATAAGVMGETVVTRGVRRSNTPLSLGGGVFGGGEEKEEGAEPVGSPVAGEEEEDEEVAQPPVSSSLATMTPASKARAKDDLLRHMESDPPSASSPVQPLTRRRMAAHDATFAHAREHSGDEDEAAPTSTVVREKGLLRPLMPARTVTSSSAPPAPSFSFPSTTRPSPPSAAPLTSRSLSLSHLTPSPLTGPSLDKTIASLSSSSHARAPGTGRTGEMACAVEALGRKRSRILETGGRTIRSVSVGAGVGERSVGEGVGVGKRRGRTATATQQQGQAKRRRSSGMTVSSFGSSSATAATTAEDLDADADADDFADLSFSSTSTASTVDSLVTVANSPTAGYFALGAAVQALEQQKAGNGKAATDDREAAELLLSMGGFF
ncbi:hypothetical protein JCM11251_000218 [Rhodosporidiobolus azoricus]